MNKNKLVYGIGLIALALAVFFLAVKAKDSLHLSFNETQSGKYPAADSMMITGIRNLSAHNNCDIVLIPADEERVVFYYDKKEVKNISVVKEGTLNIGFEQDAGRIFHFKRSRSVLVKIYTRSINSIAQEGVGAIKSEGPLVSDVLSIYNRGVGSMELDIRAKQVTIANEGVGSMDIKGTAEDGVLENDGTGSIDATQLVLKKARVSNEGVGSITVYASETLDMNNQGIGSIEYSGAATVTRSASQGIGSIKKN